jgi:CubicO group peptidase (beta-lactamase class C family)
MKGLPLLVLLLALPVRAQPLADHRDVRDALHFADLWLAAQRDYRQIPGLSVSVVHDQELVWAGAYGMANPETGVAATPDTRYSICSISKLFTSVSVMQQRDQGKLAMADPVADILPWFELQPVREDSPPVTVAGLLTHSSGLPRESAHPYWTGPDFPFPTRDEVIEQLPEQQMLYESDVRFQYSNLGLTLAGEIVRQTSGQPYEEYVVEHVLDPIGLSDTRPFLPEDQYGNRLAIGYTALMRDGGREPVSFFQARGIAPAAGFSSTVLDLGRFASWQFATLAGDGNGVLSRNTLREMHRVHWLDEDWSQAWGWGFAVWRAGDETFVGHGGSCPGYRSQLILQTRREIAVAVAANASGVDAGGFARRVYDLVAPAIEAAQDTTRKLPVEDETLAMYTGIYSELPWGSDDVVIPWKGSLAMANLGAENPAEGVRRLRRESGHTFRVLTKDGVEAHTIEFQVDDTGRVISYEEHGNYSSKVQ